jgi:hypothetical protein
MSSGFLCVHIDYSQDKDYIYPLERIDQCFIMICTWGRADGKTGIQMTLLGIHTGVVHDSGKKSMIERTFQNLTTEICHMRNM